MKIICDTREGLPLWTPEQSRGNITFVRRKLDEGDYSTELLEPFIVVERKSSNDLYNSILKGHARFKREILRAHGKGKAFHIFVECPRDEFLSMRWAYGRAHLKGTPAQLSAIIATMEKKYSIAFHWCDHRNDMRARLLYWFNVWELERREPTPPADLRD